MRTLGGLECLRLRSSANTAVESPEGNALLVLLDVGEVGVGLGKLHAGEDSCGFPASRERTVSAPLHLFDPVPAVQLLADLVFLK